MAFTCDHARSVQGLQVLGDVRVRLPRGASQRLNRPRRLGEQIEQLEPHRAGERLAHHRDRLEEDVLAARTLGHGLLFNRFLVSLSRLIVTEEATCTSGSC